MTVSQKSETKRLNSFGKVFEQEQYAKDNVIYGLRTLFETHPLYMKLMMEIYDLDWKYNAETYKKQRKIWSELFVNPNVDRAYLTYHQSAMNEVRDDEG